MNIKRNRRLTVVKRLFLYDKGKNDELIKLQPKFFEHSLLNLDYALIIYNKNRFVKQISTFL